MRPGWHRPCYWRSLSWNVRLPTSLIRSLYCVILTMCMRAAVVPTVEHTANQNSKWQTPITLIFLFSLPLLIFFFSIHLLEKFLKDFSELIESISSHLIFTRTHFSPKDSLKRLWFMSTSPVFSVPLHDLGGMVSLWIIDTWPSLLGTLPLVGIYDAVS